VGRRHRRDGWHRPRVRHRAGSSEAERCAREPTQSKLDQVQKEIQEKYPAVQVQTLAIDFASKNDEIYSKIQAALAPLDVGVLVNNVGVSYDYPMYLTELSDQRVEDLIQLNIVAVTKLTKIVLPGMEARKRGAIINVGSGSSTVPCGLLAVYAASKAYVDNFSQALAAEYGSKGIFVQSLVPWFVVSKLSKQKASLLTPKPNAYARQAVASIGYDSWTGGYWAHNLQHYIVSLLPTSFIGKQVLNLHKSIRTRAIKKAAASAKKD